MHSFQEPQRNAVSTQHAQAHTRRHRRARAHTHTRTFGLWHTCAANTHTQNLILFKTHILHVTDKFRGLGKRCRRLKLDFLRLLHDLW